MKVSITIASVAVTAVFVSACGDEPIQTPAGPGPIPNPSVQRLEVEGPGELPPGGVAQLKAIAHLTNGQTGDVTADTRWSSLRPSVASVTADGRVSALANGLAAIAASYSGHNAEKTLIIVPIGSYKLWGLVREPYGESVPSARIELISGSVTLETTTDGHGYYVLYGVPAQSTVRITSEGYDTLEQQIVIGEHARRDFQLSVPPGRENLQGEWTLIITAASSCSGVLPPEAITRRYGGLVAQRGNDFVLTLTGGTFASGFADHNQIDGRVRATDVGLSFRSFIPDYLPYPGVAEVMETNRLYAPYGEASMSPAGGGYAGLLSGSVTVGEHSSSGYRETVTCTAANHQIAMQRK